VRLIPRRGPKREPLIRPEDILLSKRITWRTDEPFTIFECAQFLPDEIFEQLATTYPWEQLRSKLQGSNLRGRMDEVADRAEFVSHLKQHPIWADLISALRSRAFRKDAHQVFRAGLRSRAPRGSILRRFNFTVLPSWLLETKCDMTAYRRGFYLTPHTDSAKKFLALLIYFPELSVQAGPNSEGTGFWRESRVGASNEWFLRLTATRFTDAQDAPLAGPKLARRFSEDDVVPGEVAEFASDFERFHVSAGLPNSAAGFVKARNSWHDVDLRHYPEDRLRGALLVNINVITLTNRRVVRFLRSRPSYWNRRFRQITRGFRSSWVGVRGPSGRGSPRSGN
jgi:hypothetical protein